MNDDTLTLLGASKTEYPTHPDNAKLECIPNAYAGKQDYTVKLDCPEFTAVCPRTGQPDFATLVIEYVPDGLLIESKALKLYLFSFRNVGMFHEFVVNKIAHDLFAAMRPKSITVEGKFLPRGGISIHPRVTLRSPAMLAQRQRTGLTVAQHLREAAETSGACLLGCNGDHSLGTCGVQGICGCPTGDPGEEGVPGASKYKQGDAVRMNADYSLPFPNPLTPKIIPNGTAGTVLSVHWRAEPDGVVYHCKLYSDASGKELCRVDIPESYLDYNTAAAS